MRIILTVTLSVFCFKLSAQDYFEGLIISSENSEGIQGAHVYNISLADIDFSSQSGAFQIAGQIGDTINVTFVGYKPKQIVLESLDYAIISLVPTAIQLEEVIVYSMPKNEHDFKRKLINQEVADLSPKLPFGVKPAKPKGIIPKLYERESKVSFGANDEFKPTFTLPISYFTKKYSKKHKAKRDYYELKAFKEQKILNDRKYNKSIVGKLTGLRGTDILDFMSYIDLRKEFLTKATAYEVAEIILKRYKEYKSRNISD